MDHLRHGRCGLFEADYTLSSRMLSLAYGCGMATFSHPRGATKRPPRATRARPRTRFDQSADGSETDARDARMFGTILLRPGTRSRARPLCLLCGGDCYSAYCRRLAAYRQARY